MGRSDRPSSVPRRAIIETEDGDVERDVSRETESVERLPKPLTTRVMVVANQKGGVGKTTSAVNLATALADGGLQVLVCDIDPQGNASTALGVPHHSGVPGTYEVILGGEAIAPHVVPSPEAQGLWVLPATVELAGAEVQLVGMVAREAKLKRALEAFLAEHPVDYVLIDCPPSLGLLTVNAFCAAQEVLLPIQCEFYALEGVSQLLETIRLVQRELNRELELTTVLLTMYDGRTKLSQEVAEQVSSHFGEQLLSTIIPRSVRISEAPSYGQSVLRCHPGSVGARAYADAALEIAERGAEED